MAPIPETLRKNRRDLDRLSQKKLVQVRNKLARAGFDIRQVLALLDASAPEMEQLKAAWPKGERSFAYDAVHELGFGRPSRRPLPQPGPREVVIRVGNWSLRELRESVVGRRFMDQSTWYDLHPFGTAMLQPGIYRLQLPRPRSNNRSVSDQLKLLRRGQHAAPVALAVTAMLVHLKVAGADLLRDDRARCAEKYRIPGKPSHRRVLVRMRSDKDMVTIDDSSLDDAAERDIWLASCQKVA